MVNLLTGFPIQDESIYSSTQSTPGTHSSGSEDVSKSQECVEKGKWSRDGSDIIIGDDGGNMLVVDAASFPVSSRTQAGYAR